MTDEEKKYLLDIFRKACAYNGVRIISDLEEEITELKENHESNKRALKLIIEKGVDLEKENAELKAQIEKMKNCENCKHENKSWYYYLCNNCDECNRWELAE